MRSEEISAPDWGLGRLTVTRDTYKMSGANFFDTTCPESKWETNSPESSNHTRVYMRSGFTRFKTYSEDNRWKISPTKCRSLTRQLSPHNSRYLWKLSTSLASINRSYAVILIITALCILCTGGVTGAVSNNKRPLIVTDATKNPDFRHFMQSNDDRPMARSSTLGEYRDPVDVLYFQTLKVITNWNGTRDILLVGGKNHVYMLDSTLIHNKLEIKYMERLTWIAPRGLRKECEMIPGQPAELCENFIRFVEVMESGELMVCGTNAFTPTCRYYTREHFNQVHDDKDSLFDRETKCRGQCVVPFNPTTASAALYTNTANGYQIFTAVQNEFMSDDPRIMRKDNPTLLSNALWLNDPTFIKIVEYEDKVYVFFREVAKQSESEYTQPITYARVAQMCKDDAGGGSVLANQWTSFLKARLVCGYSDRQHLQFNNLTSVSEITKVTGEDEAVVDVIFATFTTPWEWTDASLSAVCAFSMKEIKRGFEEGRFLQEYEIDAKPIAKADTTPDISSMRRHGSEDAVRKLTLSYPVPADDVPVPRPGSCLQTHKPEVLFFAKVHPLIYDPIEPYLNRPLFVSYNNLRATQISVDTNAGESGKLMIYLGTENGEVLRLRGMLSATEGPKAMLIESVMVGDEEICAKSGCGIRSLHVSRPPVGPSAFVAFTDYMVQFPLVRCFTYKTKGCCSIDPDCGWNGEECVHRTIENRENLLPTSKDADAIPESCNVIGENSKGLDLECDCDKKDNHHSCHHNKGSDDDDLTIDRDILDMLDKEPTNREHEDVSLVLDLESILKNSILPAMEKQFRETASGLRDNTQRQALKQQLEEALTSTTDLVLRNHRQEYCLPSPTVNHLTHVYPLLLREIELWHEIALKKMNASDFDDKCWGRGQSKCTIRVSFSIPLVPVLWEPLKKLIINFSGKCQVIAPAGGESASFRLGPSSKCSPLPGMETCKDSRQPHCYAKRCQFPKYAVDVKAFFRHANDSRQFLHHGDIEPLWKAVNKTIIGKESVRGHLELAVSDNKPFVIDYSPVAEKVKIMFHYSAVRDCALTDPMCIGMTHGCNPDVENIIDHWFKWTMNKMSHKLRECEREIKKGKRMDDRERRRLQDHVIRDERLEVTDRSASALLLNIRKSEFNFIRSTPLRCKRVGGKVRPLATFPVTNYIWSLIISRSQRTGGVYSAYHGAIEFYNISHVSQFFKNMCTFAEPTVERKTFKTRASKGRSRAVVLLQPYVTPDTSFKIQRHHSSGKVFIKYYSMEG